MARSSTTAASWTMPELSALATGRRALGQRSPLDLLDRLQRDRLPHPGAGVLRARRVHPDRSHAGGLRRRGSGGCGVGLRAVRVRAARAAGHAGRDDHGQRRPVPARDRRAPRTPVTCVTCRGFGGKIRWGVSWVTRVISHRHWSRVCRETRPDSWRASQESRSVCGGEGAATIGTHGAGGLADHTVPHDGPVRGNDRYQFDASAIWRYRPSPARRNDWAGSRQQHQRASRRRHGPVIILDRDSLPRVFRPRVGRLWLPSRRRTSPSSFELWLPNAHPLARSGGPLALDGDLVGFVEAAFGQLKADGTTLPLQAYRSLE